MFTCTSASFSAKIDSRGRITIPARIRNGFGLEEGDEVTLKLSESDRIRKKIDSRSEALKFISGIDREVESFSYNGEFLEVVLK